MSPVTTVAPGDAMTPMRFDNLQKWLDWQERLHFSAIDLGLDRCLRVARRMDLLAPGYAVITIAGTNGKGTSANLLEAMLTGAGYRTGCYTSPHLLRYNERIRIGAEEVSDEQLCRSFQRIDEARDGTSLTYFEFGTLAALDLFQGAGIDIAILEVGLGGRLDAVNILDADVALICSIDLDHEEWLGHDRESIGREKAGILRTGRPGVCSDRNIPASVVTHAGDIGAPLHLAGRDYHLRTGGGTWSWSNAMRCHDGLPLPDPRSPEFMQNAAAVLQVLDLLADRFPVRRQDIDNGLAGFRLPGRFQRIPGAIEYLLDVAHNPQAAVVLAGNLARVPAAGNTHMVIGMLRDKNHREVVSALSGAADYWYAADLPTERGLSASELVRDLAACLPGAVVSSHSGVAEALDSARTHAADGDRIVVTGSFVTVGAALNQLQRGGSR